MLSHKSYETIKIFEDVLSEDLEQLGISAVLLLELQDLLLLYLIAVLVVSREDARELEPAQQVLLAGEFTHYYVDFLAILGEQNIVGDAKLNQLVRDYPEYK